MRRPSRDFPTHIELPPHTTHLRAATFDPRRTRVLGAVGRFELGLVAMQRVIFIPRTELGEV